MAVVSAASYERAWGAWAACGYGAAALAGRWRWHGRDLALLASLGGALVAPLAWLATRARPTPDVQVVWRAALLLLRHGTPYLPPSQLVHLSGPIAYNPYLPAMALFGLPRAIGLTALAGDTRPWLAVATVGLFALALRISGRRDALRWSLLAVASPVMAFPLALGITDPPVLGLVCVALAVLSQTSPPRLWTAAVVIGVACALKATAWPALPVLTAMLAARDGARAAVRFAAAAVVAAAALVAVFAPAVLARPAGLMQNLVLFPLGLTKAQTPAASPLPGHLLAMTGPVGDLAAICLLIAAGLAVGASLVLRPPADGQAAALRLAIGLSLLFALSPATRFGYFAYPIGLCGWVVLSRGAALAGYDLAASPWPGRMTGGLSGRLAAARAARAARGAGPVRPAHSALPAYPTASSEPAYPSEPSLPGGAARPACHALPGPLARADRASD
ncbi:MAG: hypothetical protein ACLQID_26530 [Streptosporangiaceae bacterium]